MRPQCSRTPYRVAAFVAAALSSMAAAAAGQGAKEPELAPYYRFFTNEALRVDLIHTGSRGEQLFGIESLTAEPVWPGPRSNLLDPTGYGKYRVRVFSKATGQEIFSQGYCSLFGEWIATEEAEKGVRRSMSESIRFPLPKAPVALAIETRSDKTGEFEEIQRFDVDPGSLDVRRERTNGFEVVDLHDCGKEPAKCVDIVIVPDGYTAEESYKLEADALRFARVLLEYAPFDKHSGEISIRLVKGFSRESGTDEPAKGVFRDTLIDTTFDTFASARYLTTSNMKALREVASLAPYDTIMVMVNTGRYGGGGIFGSFSVFPSDSEYDEYVMLHEFGHGFGGLADEYFDSPTGLDEEEMYKDGAEPWEPNITAKTDPDKIKWKEMLTAGVEIPTPDDDENDGAVGLFEGAGYKAKGLFRPTRDSKMFHKGLHPFGPVSEAAIEKMIRYYTDSEVER